MARRTAISYRPTKRALGGLLGFLALTGSAATLALALSRPEQLWPWLLLSLLIGLAGLGAYLAQRR